MSEALLVNKEDAMLRLDNDEELYCELIDMFFDDPQFDVDAFKGFVAAGDTENAHKASHLLKGVAGTLGGDALHHACQTFEDIQKGKIKGDRVAASEILVETFYKTMEAFKEIRPTLG
ncbi:MAG: Hpt domain-containing protein [Treponemataceae bacterium]|nr:Hpt domain-containing protein [Treponemataceae bacterium]